MTRQQTSFKNHIPLGAKQATLCAVLGAVLWFLAAMLIKVLGPLGIFEGTARILLYVLVVPGTAPFIWLIAKLAGLARNQIGVGVSFATMMAVLLDGAALAWAPGLYANSVEQIAGAGAVILWGAGVGMVIGWMLNRVD